MILETNSQGSLYCTFDEKDICNYFCMSAEKFLKDKKALEKLSDILIKKAREQTGMDIGEFNGVDVTLYQIDTHRYAINIEKKEKKILKISSSKERKKYDISVSGKDLYRMMEYLYFLKVGEILEVNDMYHIVVRAEEEEIDKIKCKALEMDLEYSILIPSKKAYLLEHGKSVVKGDLRKIV